MNRAVHFEIHAAEPERAVSFYSTLFDWQFTKWAGQMDYWVIKTGEGAGIDGGLILRRGPAPVDGQAVNANVCTVEVASMDDSTQKALLAGGTLALPKMPIPGVGWLAYAKDTEGNIFGMM